MANVKSRGEKWAHRDERPIDEHFTFVQRPENLVSCSVKVNIRFLSKLTHKQRWTIGQPANNQLHVASAGPGTQHFTFYFVTKVSLNF